VPALTPLSENDAVAAPATTVPDVTEPTVVGPFFTVKVTVPTPMVAGVTMAFSVTEAAP
jgi:hypothetical protein